jgi:hypothetical protein
MLTISVEPNLGKITSQPIAGLNSISPINLPIVDKFNLLSIIIN